MTESVQQRIASLEKKVGAQSKSPLFAQLAYFYLEAGRPKDALRVCDQGLANYPFFTTGHLIKGKTLVALNMRAEARREFEWVHEYLPSNEAVSKLLAEVPPGSSETITEQAAEPEAPAATEAPVMEQAAPEVVETPPIVVETVTEEISTPEPEPGPAPVISPDLAQPPPAPVLGEPMAPLAEPPVETPAQPAEPTGFDFGAPPAPEPSVAPSPFGETPSEPQPETVAPAFGETTPASSDDAFGLGAPPTPVETPAEPAAPEPLAFAGFDFPSGETPAQPTAEPTPLPEPQAESGSPFEFPSGPAEAAAPAGAQESFEQYAMKMRGSLEGENSMSLDEYLSSNAKPEFDVIAEITEKLQTAKKITPVINLSERKTSTATEADTPSSTGFVTPTLAEIYAKQGWYDDAIKAYRTLIVTKPGEKDRFEKRIAELEELKKQQG